MEGHRILEMVYTSAFNESFHDLDLSNNQSGHTQNLFGNIRSGFNNASTWVGAAVTALPLVFSASTFAATYEKTDTVDFSSIGYTDEQSGMITQDICVGDCPHSIFTDLDDKYEGNKTPFTLFNTLDNFKKPVDADGYYSSIFTSDTHLDIDLTDLEPNDVQTLRAINDIGSRPQDAAFWMFSAVLIGFAAVARRTSLKDDVHPDDAQEVHDGDVIHVVTVYEEEEQVLVAA